MSQEPRFGRMIPAMVTPLDQNREPDFERAQQLAVRLVDGGSDALVVCGTTGESPTLSHAQKARLFACTKEAVGGRVPVIANVGGNCTRDSIDFAREAESLGVDGLMCVVPYYNKPPQEGLYRHFRAIAEAVELPVMLYNIPGRCVVNMEAETTLRLARQCANVVAVKEASGKMDQVRAIVAGAPEGFAVYSGDDAATCDVMEAGGVGVVTTTGNVAPGRMKEIVDRCAAGAWAEARAASERLMPLMEGLFETANPILVKEALKLAGFPVGGVLLPLVDATEEQSSRLAGIMREVGVLEA